MCCQLPCGFDRALRVCSTVHTEMARVMEGETGYMVHDSHRVSHTPTWVLLKVGDLQICNIVSVSGPIYAPFELCLQREILDGQREGPYDQGGYFIINGSEVLVLTNGLILGSD
ncbi:hypothetical protein RchiOBHm_Chr4g0397401 [Rosa chinensis]|uniref:DNA-directed RNA polymerase n=1 Tax=Rosa chinensis TaxID=74649 RepID=A0A2P6QS24_ROSCH|nr:hypothetical protein RchiOBHm_Chr4g0397401 [Rosa chinensis]